MIHFFKKLQKKSDQVFLKISKKKIQKSVFPDLNPDHNFGSKNQNFFQP